MTQKRSDQKIPLDGSSTEASFEGIHTLKTRNNMDHFEAMLSVPDDFMESLPYMNLTKQEVDNDYMLILESLLDSGPINPIVAVQLKGVMRLAVNGTARKDAMNIATLGQIARADASRELATSRNRLRNFMKGAESRVREEGM